MSEMHIAVVRNHEGDWEGLYVEGKLVAEGHSIEIQDVFDAMKKASMLENINVEIIYDNERRWGEYLEIFGNRFPDKFKDLGL